MIWLGLVFIGVAYDWLTTFWLVRWLGQKQTPTGDSVPVTFFRPLKVGVPQIGMKLRSFFAALQPGDQVLIGIYTDDTITLAEAQSAVADFPQVDAQIIPCRRDLARNPKINKLLQLAPLARHEHWIILDSEIVEPTQFLTQFRYEWNSAQFPVMSALYRFQNLTLATAPVLQTLLPGIVVLQRFGKIQNTLGAAVAVTRNHIEKLGGWKTLGNELAEDYELGHRLHAMGVPVQFARAVVTFENDPATFGSTFRQLHRISATYRRCQPWGFAGSIATHSIFWAVLAVIFGNHNAWITLTLASLSRVIVCLWRARAIGWPTPFWKSLVLFPISSLLETAFWFLAWLPIPIHWAGKRW